MKRVGLLAICVLMAFCISACGGDEGGIDTNLFGEWTKVRTVLRDCGNPSDNNSTTETCNDQICETLTMTDDLRYEMSVLTRGQAEIERGQIQVGETQIRFLPDNSTAVNIFSYTLSGSTFTLSNETVICTEDFVYNK